MGKEPWIIGNWKMHKTHEEAAAFIAAFLEACASRLQGKKIGIAPPFTAIPSMMRAVLGSGIMIGAQNMHEAAQGAFTGEISASMLKALGVTFVLLGHSERRQYFGETDEKVNLKIKSALAQGITPILCIGETLADREAHQTQAVLQRQIEQGLAGLSVAEIGRVVLAYEPVWAIGTGQSATLQEAQEAHAFARRCIATDVPILYGGSVKADNASAFLSAEHVDGILVGGASLEPKSFGEMI